MAIGERVPAGAEVTEVPAYFRCGVCGKVLIIEEKTVLPLCPVCANDGLHQVGIDD